MSSESDSDVDALAAEITSLSLSQTPGHLAAFFARVARFPDFTYNPAANAADEYQRLCDSYPDLRKRRGEFHTAFAADFNARFGEGEQWDWKLLCALLEIDPMPPSKNQAKKRIPHVNIYDFEHYVRLSRSGQPAVPPTRFPTVRALAVYSLDENKIYPKKKAKADAALRFMLRELFRARR